MTKRNVERRNGSDKAKATRVARLDLREWATRRMLEDVATRCSDHPERLAAVYAAACGAKVEHVERDRRHWLVEALAAELPELASLSSEMRSERLQALAMVQSVALDDPRLATWTPDDNTIALTGRYKPRGGRGSVGARTIAARMLVATGALGVRRVAAASARYQDAVTEALKVIR